MKKMLLTVLAVLVGGEAQAMRAPVPEQEHDTLPAHRKVWKCPDWVTVPKVGAYVVGTYKYDDAKGKHHGDGFGLRYIRAYVSGTVFKEFRYRVQLDFSGTPRCMDATLEWIRWKELQVKVGQFKRAFTFENPMHPWDIGFGDYAQLTKKLAGMTDRCGEAAVGGRDIGLQLQGDLFPSRRDGHRWLHYKVAVFNGQGINTKDLNKQKDLMAQMQWNATTTLSIAAFGWKGTYYSADKKITLDRKRYGFGLKYHDPQTGWAARAEYARSKGHKASDWDTTLKDWTPASMQQRGGDHADAFYAMVGIPVWRWIKLNVKYDAYRDYATFDSMHSQYCASVELRPHTNLMLQLQYNLHDDRSQQAPERYYNQFWAQMYVRF